MRPTALAAALFVSACALGPRPIEPVIVSPPSSEFSGGRGGAAPAYAAPGYGPASPAAQAGAEGWRGVVQQGDFQRLMAADEAWAAALRRAQGDPAMAGLGPLVVETSAIPGPPPGPGDYRCRMLKFGGDKGAPLTVYGWFRCRVELSPGGDLSLTKLTGSQRQRGLLYPDSDSRLAFVGAVAWGRESAAPAYGAQSDRDQVGWFERIGERRWRLVLPFPKQESVLDVLELVPA